MIREERMIECFKEMVQIDSPPLEESSMAKWLKRYFEDRGAKVTTDAVGELIGGNAGNLLVHIPGTLSTQPLAFAAHMDQIEPARGVTPVRREGRIYSDGTTTLGGDDKAGIAVILEAYEHIREEGLLHGDLYFLFTVCEEMGLQGAQYFDESLLPVKEVVIIDAGGEAGILAYKAPAVAHLKATFHGRKAHAGIEPEKGISAVKMAGEAIARLDTGRLDEITTSNIGRIEGGSSTNIVTDQVFFTAEVRSHSEERFQEEIQKMRQACQDGAEKFGGLCDFEVKASFPRLELSQESALYALCDEAFREGGIVMQPMVIGGASDGNLLAGKGFDCAIISVGMFHVHTVNEYVEIADMKKTAQALSYMMTKERN